MKIYLKGVLVVEGKEDASYLSNYIASEIVIVNGFELDKSTISYLNNRHVLALLDPDEAGKQIREKLNKELKDIVNIGVNIDKCNRGTKNGVAECEIDEILAVLKPYVVDKPDNMSAIKQSDLYALGLTNNKEKREFVCEKLNLGKCNGKTLYKRLILNNISYEKLCEIIDSWK